RKVPDLEGSDRPAASWELRKVKTTAFPSGSSPTFTEKRTPRTSENTPNHEATMDAAFSVLLSGRSANTTGSIQGRCPAGSKNGSGNRAKSFASGSFVPARLRTLVGSIVIQGAPALEQSAQLPAIFTDSVLSLINRSVGRTI